MALKGVVTGNYLGGVIVVEDDPSPTLNVVSRNVTAIEGSSLKWQFRLSAPTTGIDFYCYLIPPNGSELSSRDVPTSWLQAALITPPATPVPLSSLNIGAKVSFAYGVSQRASLY